MKKRAVDGESLARVMAYLRLADRLQAAVCVCKPWRRLRSARGLWGRIFCNNVGLLSGGLDAAEAVPLWDSMPLVGPGLARLVAWLEHKDAVDALGVRTGAYGSVYLSSAAVVVNMVEPPGDGGTAAPSGSAPSAPAGEEYASASCK